MISKKVDKREILNSIDERFPDIGRQYPWLIPPETGVSLGESINNHLKEYEKFEKFSAENGVEKKIRILFYQPDHFGAYVFIENELDLQKISFDNKNLQIRLIHKSSYGMLIKLITFPFQSVGLVEFQLKVGDIFSHLFFSWDIRWNIEINTTSKVRGWAINKILPTIPMVVNIYRNEILIKKIESISSRNDVKDALQLHTDKCGFDEPLDSKLHGLQVQKILVSDSNILLSKDHMISVSPSYASQFTRKIKRLFKNHQSTSLIEQNFLEKIASSFTPEVFEAHLRGIGQNINLQIPNSRVDNNLSVVIPVYDGLEETIACINSVINSKCNQNLQIIIGFDNGPDRRILDYLYSVENKNANVKLIVNDENLGFVKNVNNLVKNKIHNDFVLLNADAIVFDGFFDRIHGALNSDRTYASLTPLSNHATIFSYINSTASIDLCRTVDKKLFTIGDKVVPTPVGHGFCMLINGDIHRKIGMFSEQWGKGYGEEVDWCLRTQKITGLRHGSYLGALVFHKGSVSFGMDQMSERVRASDVLINKIYPDYALDIANYELDGALNSSKIALDQRLPREKSGQYHLFITHSFGGGIDTYIKTTASKFDKYLICSMVGDEDRGFYWKIYGSDLSVRYFKVAELDLLKDWFSALDVGSASLEHFGIASPQEVSRLLSILICKYTVMLHDYGMICPRICLIDHEEKYCGVGSNSECAICISKAPIQSSGAGMFSKVNFVSDLRAQSTDLLRGAASIYSPSISTAENYKKIDPSLRIKIKPHQRDIKFSQRIPRSKFSKTIVIVGGISIPKGLKKYKEFADFLQINEPDFKIVFIGNVEDESLFRANKNVRITGGYNSKDLSKLIDFYDPFACLHFNIWPETFSYVLSETLKNGLYPFYFKTGAIFDRLNALSLGNGYEDDERMALIAKDITQFHKKLWN